MILLVEDEPAIRSGIRINLEAEGFSVLEFPDADSAAGEISRTKPLIALGILDIMMPGKLNGLDLCAKLREMGQSFPVIFLTARGRLEDKLAGFKSGADDYVTKPFELEELIARIYARLGKKAKTRIGKFQLDFESATAESDSGEIVRFNDKEIQMLSVLAQNRGKPVRRDEILDAVWGADFPTNRTIDNFIVKFRKIFEDDPAQPVHFITRHGTGYELSQENV